MWVVQENSLYFNNYYCQQQTQQLEQLEVFKATNTKSRSHSCGPLQDQFSSKIVGKKEINKSAHMCGHLHNVFIWNYNTVVY